MSTIDATRIEDDTSLQNLENAHTSEQDKLVSLFEDIDREIKFQTETSENTIGDIPNEEPRVEENWKYPIDKNMFQDLNYHARSCMFVNMYICPYQIRVGTDNKTPFIQYMMKKANDRSEKDRLHFHDCNYIDFHKVTFFDHQSEYVNLYDAALKNVKIMMMGYGKMNDAHNIIYKGFRKRENDFYVFFDISDVWINHHYLNMHDPLWLVNMYEMSVLKEVCSVPICDEVVSFLNENKDIVDIYYPDDSKVAIPVIGFTIEEKKQMDFNMTFGTSSQKYKDLDDAFVYYYDYNQCCQLLDENERSNKVIMRNVIMYDESMNYEEYIKMTHNDENRILIVDNIQNETCGFITHNHIAQTPITAHNILNIS